MTDHAARPADVALVVTAGRERRAAHPGLRALARAIDVAGERDLACEVVIVLTDPHEDTLALVQDACRGDSTLRGAARAVVEVVEEGGCARRRGIELTTAPLVGFVRAVDLVSPGWIVGAVDTVRARPNAVVHPEVQLDFGAGNSYRVNVGTDESGFARWGLIATDAWDDLGFTSRDVLTEHPLPPPSPDLMSSPQRTWHWTTLEAGVAHLVAPGTSLHRRTEGLHPDPFEAARGDDLAPFSATLRSAALAEQARDEQARAEQARAEQARPHPPGLPEGAVAAWWELYPLEPLICAPTPDFVAAMTHRPWFGDDDRAVAQAYWSAVRQLPERVEALYLAPGLRMGGGDSVALNYLRAARELRPDWSVAALLTDELDPTRLDEVPPGVTVGELTPALRSLNAVPGGGARALALLVGQFRPELVHAINTGRDPYGMIESYGHVLARYTRLFVTSFSNFPMADGVLRGQMLRRSPGFLDHVTSFIGDCDAFCEELYARWRYDRSKLTTHYQPAALADYVRTRGSSERRKILWVGRFDWQKRLDVLADVAEALLAAGVDAEVHFYGEAVLQDAEIEPHLRRLAEADAVRHPAFTGGVGSLPLDEFALALMTPSYEGLPLFLTQMAAAAVPVVAPAVGGIPEVIGDGRGYLVSHTEAIDEYVEQITRVLADPGEAHRRAEAARAFVTDNCTWEPFTRRIAATPGYLRPRQPGPSARTAPGR